MAVRHGYGKIAGTDALIFAYDTGDTRNSYRGEPTTNLLPAGVASGHNSGGYGNVVTVTDATVEKGPGWKKVTISNRGSNFRIIQWSYLSMLANNTYCFSAEFDWGNMRDKGYYINHDGDGAGSRTFYLPGNYTTGQGSILSITSSVPNGKIAGIISKNVNHTHSFFINNPTTGSSGLNDYFYYKDFQVEINTHPTQYTTGTRSSTQGLLDLTGRRAIDLSNVSFDSNAQMEFDGTDDGTQVSTPIDLSSYSAITVEGVYRGTGVGPYDRWFSGTSDTGYHYPDLAVNSSGQHAYRFSSILDSWTNTGIALPTNKHNHIVYTFTTAGAVEMYTNGELAYNTAHSAGTFPSVSRAMIGNRYDRNGEALIGSIPVVKMYGRKLTADEVRNNYNQYKTRFNI